MADFSTKTTLGRTGLAVSRIGLGSSYGLEPADVEHAFDHGVNYFYWGTIRQPEFGAGIRKLAPKHRDRMVVVVQSYSRVAALMRRSIDAALAKLGIDYADLLLLGLWNAPPPRRIRDAAQALVEAGKARHVIISAHHRPAFAFHLEDPLYGAIMVRYSAAHQGAENDVFPLLEGQRSGTGRSGAGRSDADRPGVIGYTATRWAALLDPALVPEGEPVPTATNCYRFVLSDPRVDVCLAGPAGRAQLDEALETLDRGPMDAGELAWMRRVGKVVRERARSSPRSRAMRIIDRLTGKPWLSR